MEYVSFDTAKLLKEKGYPQCKKKEGYAGVKYTTEGELVTAPFANHYAAPTIYVAMKWLKDNHGIDIDTDTVWGMDKVITYYVKGYRFQLHSPIFPNYDVNEIFLTREIAYDKAIKKCLTDLI